MKSIEEEQAQGLKNARESWLKNKERLFSDIQSLSKDQSGRYLIKTGVGTIKDLDIYHRLYQLIKDQYAPEDDVIIFENIHFCDGFNIAAPGIVTVAITFKNCQFQEKFINSENDNRLYSSDAKKRELEPVDFYRFEKEVRFIGCSFVGKDPFKFTAGFEASITFQECTFEPVFKLAGRYMLSCHFLECILKKVPDFANAVFSISNGNTLKYCDVSFSGSTFPDVKDVNVHDAITRYRSLKGHMLANGQSFEAQRFHALESNAALKSMSLRRDGVDYVLSHIYRKINDYGFAYFRPSLWILCLGVVVFAALFLLNMHALFTDFSFSCFLKKTFMPAFKGAMGPFGIPLWKSESAAYASGFWFWLYASFCSVLWFFLLLGIRKRFKVSE